MLKKLFLIQLLLLSCFAAISQPSNLEQDEHLLDGKSFTYQYQSGSAIEISFQDGKLTYQWIAGRSTGKPVRTYPYKSRQLDQGVYLVNWHEPTLKNFITLVYNLNNNTCASSVIVNYGSEESFQAFDGGIIEHVKEIE